MAEAYKHFQSSHVVAWFSLSRLSLKGTVHFTSLSNSGPKSAMAHLIMKKQHFKTWQRDNKSRPCFLLSVVTPTVKHLKKPSDETSAEQTLLSRDFGLTVKRSGSRWRRFTAAVNKSYIHKCGYRHLWCFTPCC